MSFSGCLRRAVASRSRLTLLSKEGARWSQAPVRQLSQARVLRADEGEGTHAVFAGASTYITTTAKIIRADEAGTIPCYRLLGTDGVILNPDDDPHIDDETLVHWYKQMVQLNTMDTILYQYQRQGRISFYMTSFGEEATHIGSGAAIVKGDITYAQYREVGVLLYLGYTMEEIMNQCWGNNLGHGKGRQMPVHYGSKELNFHTISSPLGTQLPQAAGAAYAVKGEGKCVFCYFGDGSASEGDAHPAFNFAATLECPVVFFCRNNGFAISTPVHEQYRGDGIASRASGYGMDVIRVDGNDVMAIYKATALAREIAVNESRPVLIEAMTYRASHHSTSDDASAYRGDEEAGIFQSESAMHRFNTYITKKGLWDQDKETELKAALHKEITSAAAVAESINLPSVDSLFEDVYDDIPLHLQRQQKEMREHMAKYKDVYSEEGRASSS